MNSKHLVKIRRLCTRVKNGIQHTHETDKHERSEIKTYSQNTQSWKKQNKNVHEQHKSNHGTILLEGFKIFAWSISGLESCVVVKNDQLKIAFDMGYACRPSVECNHVFISHGHMDHISGVPQHACKRGLYKMSKANYYIPEYLVNAVKSVGQTYCDMSENTTPEVGQMNIIPVTPGDKIELSKEYYVMPFPTVHRIRSRGFLLYRRRSIIKPELNHQLTFHEKNELARKEKDTVSHTIDIPLIAYTGDTTFELFKNCPITDILNVRLLITEATYIDDSYKKDMVEIARDRGHIHLNEFIDNACLFENVNKILLMHFSDRYSPGYIKRQVYSKLPYSLSSKVHIATHAKKLFYNF